MQMHVIMLIFVKKSLNYGRCSLELPINRKVLSDLVLVQLWSEHQEYVIKNSKGKMLFGIFLRLLKILKF
jgi:hypothetical protein